MDLETVDNPLIHLEELEALRKENSRLKDEIIAFKSTAENSQLREENLTLKFELQSVRLKEEVQRLKDENQKLGEENRQLKSEISTLKAENEKLKGENLRLLGENQALTKVQAGQVQARMAESQYRGTKRKTSTPVATENPAKAASHPMKTVVPSDTDFGHSTEVAGDDSLGDIMVFANQYNDDGDDDDNGDSFDDARDKEFTHATSFAPESSFSDTLAVNVKVKESDSVAMETEGMKRVKVEPHWDGQATDGLSQSQEQTSARGSRQTRSSVRRNNTATAVSSIVEPSTSQSQSPMWLVVEFLDTEELLIVPDNWIDPQGRPFIMLPPYLTTRRLQRASQRREPPKPRWKSFSYRLINSGQCATYAEAEEKMRISECYTDLASSCSEETNEVDLQPKRKIVRLSQNLEEEEEQTPASSSHVAEVDVHSFIFTEMMEQMMKKIEDIDKKVNSFGRMVNPVDESELPLPEGIAFPIQTPEAWLHANTILLSAANEKAVLQTLRIVGGSSPKETIYNTLKFAISNDLAMKLTWTGAGQKLRVEGSRVQEIIFKAVRMNRVAAFSTTDELKKHTQDWLRNAADREGGRKRRAERTAQERSAENTTQEEERIG